MFICFCSHLILVKFIFIIQTGFATIIVKDKGIFPLEKNSVGIQFYIDIENKDRSQSCKINSWPDNCYLNDTAEEDCSIMSVYGKNVYTLKPKQCNTLIFIYPSIYQHDLVGYCDFVLNYRCIDRVLKKQHIRITFDTTILDKSKSDDLISNYVGDNKVAICDTLDQNSLDDCDPINCDIKYDGARPIYDNSISKCVEVPECKGDVSKQLPDIIYVPFVNVCRDLENPLTVGDIYAISTRLGVVTESAHYEGDITVELKSNCTTISQNINLLRDMMYGKLCPVAQGEIADYSKCCKSAFISIIACIAAICGIYLSFLCCISTIVWLYKRRPHRDFGKFWKYISNTFKRSEKHESFEKTGVNSTVRNALLRDVIARDIPIELRHSVVNICERMDQEVRHKRRYRRSDVGSQVSLCKKNKDAISSGNTSPTCSLEDCNERDKLIK